MPSWAPLLVAPPAAAAAWWLTARVLAVVRARGIVDVPNERSSHDRPTPRGGGVAVVAVVTLIAAVGFAADRPARSLWAALLAGGLIVATVGFVDDVRHLSPPLRLVAHLAAAVLAIALVAAPHAGGLLVLVVAAGAVVWLVNLYNFMDGIDGIAGVEGVTVGAGMGVLLSAAGDTSLAAAAFAVAGAAAGFLRWNWPPARIFLGDVGSGYFGYVFAVLAVAAASRGSLPVTVSAILLGVFVVDATATLVRRILRGERWYSAHRSHAYQRAAQRLGGHRPVTLAVAGVNVLLVAVAIAAVARPELAELLWAGTTAALLAAWWVVVVGNDGAARQRVGP